MVQEGQFPIPQEKKCIVEIDDDIKVQFTVTNRPTNDKILP